MSQRPDQTETLPLGFFIGLIAVALLATLWLATRDFLLLAAIGGISELGLALMVFISAGGWGYFLVRIFAPPSAGSALRVFTSVGVGLWCLSMAMLLAGTIGGLFKPVVWWPIVLVGLLAGWWGRSKLENFRLPQRIDGWALVWVPAVLAGGIWLAGATQPAGHLAGFGDSYDILEYHLQLPREFLLAGKITSLEHNTYSHYPLAVHMLFLLAMVLRGGAYEGMYLAATMHGMFAVLSVCSVYAVLRKDNPIHARFSAVLLATAPLAVYLGWLAMVELAVLCYMVLAVLWLREWFQRPSPQAATWIGIMTGAACGVKYLSAGFVAGPVLAVMLIAGVIRLRLIPHVILAAGLCLLVFSPWVVRNALATGNPVFPLAGGLFGHGHWPDESARRWQAGHAPGFHAPVPPPPNYKPPDYQPGRVMLIHTNFISNQMFGPVVLILAGMACSVTVGFIRYAGAWNLSLVGIAAVQIAVWSLFTKDSPARFLTPILASQSLLSGWLLAELAGVVRNPFSRRPHEPTDRPWGLVVSAGLFITAVAVNLIVAYNVYRAVSPGPMHGISGELIFRQTQKDLLGGEPSRSARIMMLGDARAFYMPQDSIYATVFDVHPLIEMIHQGLSQEQILCRLKELGVDFIVINWFEILRLGRTYGFAAEIGQEVFERFAQAQPPDLQMLRDLQKAGLKVQKQLYMPPIADLPPDAPAPWPVISTYALPWAPEITAE